jgi:hypothetical protein
MSLYVQYGCGFSAADGWLNFDNSPTLLIERLPFGKSLSRAVSGNPQLFPPSVRYGDIRRGLPIVDGTAKGCFASHVLEHMALADLRIALRNTLKIMQPGGIFRLVVPDLRERARRYLAASDAADSSASHDFLRSTHLGCERRPHGVIEQLRHFFGGSMHLWMWDEPSMSAELTDAGFIRVRRCALGDCADTAFSKVEDQGRFFDTTKKISELAIEASAPS